MLPSRNVSPRSEHKLHDDVLAAPQMQGSGWENVGGRPKYVTDQWCERNGLKTLGTEQQPLSTGMRLTTRYLACTHVSFNVSQRSSIRLCVSVFETGRMRLPDESSCKSSKAPR